MNELPRDADQPDELEMHHQQRMADAVAQALFERRVEAIKETGLSSTPELAAKQMRLLEVLAAGRKKPQG